MSSRSFFASLFLAAAAFALTTTAFASAAIGSGYSGMWFDPARNGEGLQLDILDADKAVVYWYTYDEAGAQRWLFGVGQIVHDTSGDSIRFPEVQVTHGGKFGSGIKPSDVTYTDVGSIDLSFSDCNNGTFKYSAYGQSQSLPVQRLTQTMGAGCQSINGVPGEPIQPYAGQSGNWFDISHSGEGFDLHWMSNGQAIVSWYTYDASGNQAWLIGVGTPQNDTIVFNRMFSASGPKFGTAFDTTQYQEHDWGTLTMTLNCDSGTAHYASTQTGFGSGNFTLTRLTALQKPACPYVNPAFSDLYSIAWDEIPVSDGTSNDPNAISIEAIANGGTLAGRRAGHLVLWHPDTRTWEDIPRDLNQYSPILISPDGQLIVSGDGPDSGPNNTLLWQRSTGWQVLPSAITRSLPFAASHDFQMLVGGGDNGDYRTFGFWVAPVGGAQELLPTPIKFTQGASAVSNDGRTVVGYYSNAPFDLPKALRWDNGGQPTEMPGPDGEALGGATACDANCDIVFGSGRTDYHDNPRSPEAWFSKRNGTFAYLGALPDADASMNPYYGGHVTSDGTLLGGAYMIDSFRTRAFIWTQATGIVPVRSLVSSLGIGDDDWDEQGAVVTSNGGKILLVGSQKTSVPGAPSTQISRAVVLHLTPKISTN